MPLTLPPGRPSDWAMPSTTGSLTIRPITGTLFVTRQAAAIEGWLVATMMAAPEFDQLGSQARQPILFAVRIAVFEYEVASLNQPKRLHSLAESLELIGRVLPTLNLQPAKLWNWMRWLCARRMRQSNGCGAAKQCDELSSLIRSA